MTLAIPAELEDRLRLQARRLGVSVDEYAAKLLAANLPPAAREQSLAELFANWALEDATDDPDEIARRNAEFEELKQAMNRSRVQMEGPGARTPFL
jgi:hypothetical protein